MLAPETVNCQELATLNAGEKPSATFKASPEDFQVIEQLTVEDEHDGEHQWLWVRKRGANTVFCAEKIARFAGVSPKQVSYSGLKDRQAVTWQWFSIQLPGKDTLDWQSLNDDEMTIEKVIRRTKKLRSGLHSGNRFVIRLHSVSDMALLKERWKQVTQNGAINYFGEQRFGRNGDNVAAAERWIMASRPKRLSKAKRGLYLSALRSFLFNLMASERAKQLGADSLLEGDCAMLAGSNSMFTVEQWDHELKQRLASKDIEIALPLPGSANKSMSAGESADFEDKLLEPYQSWIEALAKLRVDEGRRAWKVIPGEPELKELDGSTVELSFTLPSGAYATTILNEIATISGEHK